VSADQLRQWLKEGRANAQTKVQPEGSTEWKPLSDLPEFAGLPGVGTPPTPAVNPDALAAEIIARDYQVNIGDCVSRAWRLLKSDFWLLVGASFVAGIIGQNLGIISLIIGGPMMGGLCALYLKKIRKQPAQFGDIFIGFSTAFVPLMLAYIVAGLLTGLGFLFCILPGVYLAVAWMFTIALVIDKKLDFWPAMELSRKVVNKHWWSLFGLVIVLGLLALAGVLACCIGVFVTASIAQVALVFAYEDIFGSRA
jgi:hypothetical protein